MCVFLRLSNGEVDLSEVEGFAMEVFSDPQGATWVSCLECPTYAFCF